MDQLPDVNDDLKNILQAVRMMKIPSENTFAFKNIKFNKVKEIITRVTHLLKVKTRSLGNRTGIFGQ